MDEYWTNDFVYLRTVQGIKGMTILVILCMCQIDNTSKGALVPDLYCTVSIEPKPFSNASNYAKIAQE